jgi:UDP-glucuronate 4-epimerase
MTILVTGAAGFIGMHVAQRLLARGEEVLGLDDLNPYYDPALKQARLDRLQAQPGFRFSHLSIEDTGALNALFDHEAPRRVVHLAAQPGVRHSVQHPHACAAANLQGFLNVLEGCRRCETTHLVFASSSSVYGASTRLPFAEGTGADHPVSLYAATKRANELMAHAYSHLFRLPMTGARLFTVYGPWGRPDMAVYRFTDAIAAGRPIELNAGGRMLRDFTYVDDVADALVRLLDKPATPAPPSDRDGADPAESDAPFRVFNVGGSRPLPLLDLVEALEEALGRPAVRHERPMPLGDVPATAADGARLQAWIGSAPATPLREGVGRFVGWYREYHGLP